MNEDLPESAKNHRTSQDYLSPSPVPCGVSFR